MLKSAWRFATPMTAPVRGPRQFPDWRGLFVLSRLTQHAPTRSWRAPILGRPRVPSALAAVRKMAVFFRELNRRLVFSPSETLSDPLGRVSGPREAWFEPRAQPLLPQSGFLTFAMIGAMRRRASGRASRRRSHHCADLAFLFLTQRSPRKAIWRFRVRRSLECKRPPASRFRTPAPHPGNFFPIGGALYWKFSAIP
jgi:hypothetical protein